MTAHVSIVFTRYMFLAVEQRESKDDRSIGELFYLSVDELPDLCYAEAVRLLVSLFVARLQEHMILDEGEVQELLQGFLAELPMLLSQTYENVHRSDAFLSTKPQDSRPDVCF